MSNSCHFLYQKQGEILDYLKFIRQKHVQCYLTSCFAASGSPCPGLQPSCFAVDLSLPWVPLRLLSASRTRTQMKILRGVQNEMFTFEIDSENALVGSTLER